MSQRRGTITDQLINVIQVLQMGRRTGRLLIERDSRIGYEYGELHLVRGQITEAHSGSHWGQQAVNWLNTWGICRFTFEAFDAKQATGPLASFRQTTKPLPEQEQTPSWKTASHSGQFPAIQLSPARQGRYPSGTFPTTSQPYTSDQFASFQTSPMLSQHWLALCPNRTLPDAAGMQRITAAGLSRLHLRLYLLVDGQRTVTELLRLLGRAPTEILRLLQDLIHIDVIQLEEKSQ